MRVRTLLIGASLIAIAMPALAAETIAYSYDARGRLVKIERSGTAHPSSNPPVTTTYTLDEADNRTNKTITGSPNPPPP